MESNEHEVPLFTADELAANAPLPTPSIIADGLFPECGTWLITGKTEHLKSVLAFDIAISLVLQQPLFRAIRKKHGQEGKPFFPIHRPCKVLYLDSELGPQGCHQRLKAFVAARGIGVPLTDFIIVSGAFEPLLLHEPEADKRPYANLRKLLTAVKPDVLIVDPLGDYHLLNEDGNEMRIVFRNLRALQNEFKFASILLHHESDKQIFDSRGMPIEKEGTGRSRGHSSITQSVDTYMSVRRLKKDSRTFIEFQWEKVRHQQRPPAGYIFVDLKAMRVEWFCSNREHGIPSKLQAHLDAYRAANGEDGDE